VKITTGNGAREEMLAAWNAHNEMLRLAERMGGRIFAHIRKKHEYMSEIEIANGSVYLTERFSFPVSGLSEYFAQSDRQAGDID
jgi:hypothetical protein